jgi:hypothetical protein
MKTSKYITSLYIASVLIFTVGRSDAMEEDEYLGLTFSSNGYEYHEFHEEANRCGSGGRRCLMDSRSEQINEDLAAGRRLNKAGHRYQVFRNHIARGYIEQFDPWEIFRVFLSR